MGQDLRVSQRDAAAELGRNLGRAERGLVILAEGNTSAREDSDTFWVKASGFSLCGIGPDGFLAVKFSPIFAALRQGTANDEEVRQILSDARAEPGQLMPSVETFMHAYLLNLTGVAYVGHTHPVHMLSILCLADAKTMAATRVFPDEVVCCGPASAFVPYVDPGLPLALAIRDSVEQFVDTHGELPKTIWLANHGLIAIGKSPAEVESATSMSEKSAKIRLGSLASQKAIRYMDKAEIERIRGRPDEHYRQRLLWELRQNPIQ